MVKKSILLLFLLCNIYGHAAGPVTHIFLAEKWMQIVDSIEQKDRSTFISGNLFPDIRYLGEVTREETHETGITLDDIIGSETPFQAGTRLHAYVDEIREAIVVDADVYRHINMYAQGHAATLLKLIEDEMFYDRIAATEAIGALAKISEEERGTGISLKCLEKWHRLMVYYLGLQPSTGLTFLARFDKSFSNVPKHTVIYWSLILPLLVKKKELIEHVKRLDETFTQLFNIVHKN